MRRPGFRIKQNTIHTPFFIFNDLNVLLGIEEHISHDMKEKIHRCQIPVIQHLFTTEVSILNYSAMHTLMQKSLLLAGFILLSCLSAFSQKFEVEGLYYNVLSEDDHTVEVTHYKMAGENFDYVSGVLDIPSAFQVR